MSVDKFGRHSAQRRILPQRGPKGEGFHVTADGDYDIQSKRLKFVNDPEDALDAVNLKTLGEKCLSENQGVYDANGKIITNVSNNPFTHNDSDVVNKKYVNESFVRYNYKNAQQLIGTIDAKNNLIKNLLDPQSPQDATTKKYVDSKTPEHGTYDWKFFHKKLKDITDPIDKQDAVNLRYFQNNSPRIDAQARVWAFSKYRLSEVAKPLYKDDAVNKQYYKEGLADLSYTLYKLTHGNRRAALISPSDWKEKVMLSTPWDTLFK